MEVHVVWNEKERRLMDRDWYGVERRMEQKSAWNRYQYRMEGRKTLLDQ